MLIENVFTSGYRMKKKNGMAKHKKRDVGRRREFYVLVEKKLKDEFLEKRTNGLAVEMWWFRSRT